LKGVIEDNTYRRPGRPILGTAEVGNPGRDAGFAEQPLHNTWNTVGDKFFDSGYLHSKFMYLQKPLNPKQ